MKKTQLVAAMTLMLAMATLAIGVVMADKLPKCSGQLCHDTCSSDILCAKGTSVITCAQYCGGGH
jgi:hypothetical protein